MMVLLTRLPTIGSRPQRNVIGIMSGALGRADDQHENGGQNSINERDGHLCAHDEGEASVEIAKSRRDLIAQKRSKIILRVMRIAIKIELAVKEQTHGGDNPDENEEQGCGRASGETGDASQIVRFFFKRVDQQCPETVRNR